MMRFSAFLILLLVMFECTAQTNSGMSEGIDGYPAYIAGALKKQQADEISAANKSPVLQEQFLINSKRWDAGSTVLVAFNGGPTELHRAIADVASKWSKFANIRFDFGFDAATGKYRSWSADDKIRAAHIRIGFAAPGFWSAVGTDSMIDDPFGPGKASMNFEKFVEGWPNLITSRWKTVVLHEFGHALGFRHEHQQERCFSEVRWEPGPNGEPDIYQVFKNWQGWNRDVVDVNMRPAQMSKLNLTSPMDIRSIMYYASPAQIYRLGDKSVCFLAAENKVISPEDARGAMLAYPKDPSHAVKIAALSASQMEELFASASASFSEDEKLATRRRISSQGEASRPLVYIHIQRELDRGIARDIQARSGEAGFFAPGIENVAKKNLKSGKHAQVRYFRTIDREYAERQAGIVKDVIQDQVDILQVKGLAKTVTRNMVEVWLP